MLVLGVSAVPNSLNQSAWIAHLCLIICASAIMITGAVYARDIVVPLTLAWFCGFLVGPIMDFLEQRPLVLFGTWRHQPSEAAAASDKI